MASDNLRAELERVRESRGTLTPATVVADATSKASSLHPLFEWDNKLAGHKYRLVQAQELIRSVVIDVVIDEKPEKVRAFVSVPRPEGRSYEPVEDVASDPFVSQLVLREAEREWRSLFKRYGHLSAFIAIIRKDVA